MNRKREKDRKEEITRRFQPIDDRKSWPNERNQEFSNLHGSTITGYTAFLIDSSVLNPIQQGQSLTSRWHSEMSQHENIRGILRVY